MPTAQRRGVQGEGLAREQRIEQRRPPADRQLRRRGRSGFRRIRVHGLVASEEHDVLGDPHGVEPHGLRRLGEVPGVRRTELRRPVERLHQPDLADRHRRARYRAERRSLARDSLGSWCTPTSCARCTMSRRPCSMVRSLEDSLGSWCTHRALAVTSYCLTAGIDPCTTLGTDYTPSSGRADRPPLPHPSCAESQIHTPSRWARPRPDPPARSRRRGAPR